MKRKLTLSTVAVLALVASACGGGSSSGGSDGIASLDSIAPAAIEAEPTTTDDSADDSIEGEPTGDDAQADQADGDATEGDDAEPTAGDSASSDAGEVTDEDIEQAFLEYDQCLADIGLGALVSGGSGGAAVDVEGDEAIVPSDGAVAMTDEQFERMEEECNPIVDAVAGSFEASPEQEAEMRDAELEFARCMRDQGVDMPDPTSSGGGFEIQIDGDGAFDQDAMDEAFETCDSVFDELFNDEES